jgi:hypothetical protein
MQAYMKSMMPYHAVPAQLLRHVCKTVFADEIKRYVRVNRGRLSALSCREALKNL